MKLSRKALSCLLAILMIVSSMSVSFTVFGASASQVNSIIVNVQNNYDGLMEAIDSGDPGRVPRQTATGQWVVETDTYTSGWLSVARAFAAYVKAAAGSLPGGKYTYADYVNEALAAMDGNSLLQVPKGDVKKVLDYFKFGQETSGVFSAGNFGVLLTIGTGYDILAWEKAEDIDEDMEYQRGSLKFTVSPVAGGYGIASSDNVTFTSESHVDPETDTEVHLIKAALLDCLSDEAFKKWFGLDLDSMGVEEIMTLVQGDKSCAMVLKAFSDVAGLSISADAKSLWDHYIAKEVGKTYDQTQEWINSGLREAIYKAYAADYQNRFNELMAVNYKNFTAEETLNHYLAVVELLTEFEEKTDFDSDAPVADKIAAYFSGGPEYITTVKNYIKKLSADVARAYAKVYADELNALAAENVPTYDHEDEAAAGAWEGSDEQKQAQDFLDRASVMIVNIDKYVLGFGTFDDVAETFSENGKRVSKELYDKLKEKMASAELDCNGASYYQIKAQMDAYIATTTHVGKRIAKLRADFDAFRILYNQAVALSSDESKKAVFDKVFTEGLTPYTEYINSLKGYVADRFYDLYYTVEKYYYGGQSTGSVTYYNFEAIIDSFEAAGKEGVSAVLGFLTEAPAYVPAEGHKTVAELQALANRASGYYNTAINFRTGLKNLANTASGNDKQILNNIFDKNTASGYKNFMWVSAIGKLDYTEVQQFVSEIKLAGYPNASLADIQNLMDKAVDDISKLIVSEDFITLLNSLMTAEDGSGGLGTWEYDYKDTKGVVHKAGTPLKTLTDVLVNLVQSLLFSGDIPTMILSAIYPEIGKAIADQVGGQADLVRAGIRMSLPNYPHQFLWGSSYNNTGEDSADTRWCQWFNGDNGKNPNLHFEEVLAVISQARYYKSGTYAKSDWEDIDWSKLNSKTAWHIKDKDGLYYALAAATCGLALPLRTLLVGNEESLSTSIVGASIKLQNNGDRLYERLFIPLYNALGIKPASVDPNGYASVGTIEQLSRFDGNMGSYVFGDTVNGRYTPFTVGFGQPLWKALLDPIFYWMDAKLFADPVSTLLEVLPNLMAMLEYNQVMPKLRNIVLNLNILSVANVPIPLSDVVLPLLTNAGIDLEHGLDGILSVLIKATKTTSYSGDTAAYLMQMKKDEGGNNVITDKPVYYNNRYYNNLGLLTQTLYGLFGDTMLDWMEWSGNNGSVPLHVPVNRFMAACQIAAPAQNYGSWHLNADKGDMLLSLVRWLLDDGTLYKFVPLLEGLIPPAEDGSSILDTILPILDGQADMLLAMLICLLNDYLVDYEKYADKVKDGTFVDSNGVPYLGDGYSSKFELGQFLEQSLSDTGKKDANGKPVVNTDYNDMMAKADLAVDNIDVIIQSLVPTIVGLLGDTLGGIGMGSVVDRVNSGELKTIEDIVMKGVISNDLITTVMQLLFGTRNADRTLETGVLGGLIGGTPIVGNLLEALAQFGIDITPLGFYKAAGKTSGFNGHSVARWLAREAEIHYGENVPAAPGSITGHTSAWYEGELAKMSWADIGVESGMEWIIFALEPSNEVIWSALSGFLCTLLAPLNPLLSLILCGEDITLMDELTIQGNEGYGRSVVPILEALGISADKIKTQTEYNQFIFHSAAPNKGSNRFATMYASPLAPVFDALGELLVGSGSVKGLLDSPIAVLFEKLPNIAYFLYQYPSGELKPNGQPKTTNNLSKAVANLIAPVLKLLKIADPVLARVLNFDLQDMLDQYLDLETLLNTLVTGLLGNGEANINLSVLDFGRLAADSSSSVDVNAPTKRGEGVSSFTKFNSTKGQLLITLIRNVFTGDMIDMVAEIINKAMNWDEVTNPDEVEAQERINKIVKGISSNLKKDPSNGLGGHYVDIITGIIIDVLTDYTPDKGEYYFYEVMNKVDGEITSGEQSKAWETYQVKHGGYDWESTKDKFTKDKVELAITNIDYVIQKAVPDIVSALQEEGILGELPIDLKVVEDGGLWALIQGVLSDNLLTDNIFDTVANLVFGLIGGIDMKTADMVMNAVKAVGFDITAESFIKAPGGGKSQAFGYVTYGFRKDASGNLIPDGKGSYQLETGKYAPLSWEQIYTNHTHLAYKYYENGVVVTNAQGLPVYRQLTTVDEETGEEIPVTDENGNPVYAREMIESGAIQEISGVLNQYVYTYEKDGVTEEYLSDWQYLKAAEIGGVTYTLTPKYTADSNWNWGVSAITGADDEATYTARKNKLISNVWELVAPFAPLISMLLAGDGLKLLNGGLNIEGNTAYGNVFLPILRAFGLEEILRYIDETPYDAENPNGETMREHLNAGKAQGEEVPNALMAPEEFYKLVYGSSYGTENPQVDTESMGEAFSVLINNILYFVEILATYPVQTLATALPTLAYFIYGDGLTTVLSNVLVPITTFTNRLKEVVNLDINNIGAGLIDVLITGSWAEFQNALNAFVQVDDDGNFIVDDSKTFSLTDSLLTLLTGFEFDLSSILAGNDDNIEEGEYNYGLMLFINKDVELQAKELLANAEKLAEEGEREQAAQCRERAREIRSGTLKQFFYAIAALGDPYTSGEHKDYVKIDEKGQVSVSKAEILMFLLSFIFENTTIKEMLGGVLGYDITDENGDDAELLDVIITNVFNNPDQLVDVIVSLVTYYDVESQNDVTLIPIDVERHYEFYEDFALESPDEIKEGSEISEISRIKTSAAIDNLDKLVATVLNVFKEQLVAGENAPLASLGVPADIENLSLKALVDTILENMVYNDDGLNNIMGMLIGLLGDPNSSQIVNIALKILDGAGYSLVPQTFKNNVPALADVIGDAKKWSEVAKNNTMYVYKNKDGEVVYDKSANAVFTPVYVQATDEDGNLLWEDEEQTIPVYSDVRATAIHLDAQWNITNRDELVDLLWNLIKPLRGILEAFLTGGNITVYDKVNIRGFKGYEGVVLPLLNALAVSELADSSGKAYIKNYYGTYADYENAVADSDGKVLLTSITDALFAFVDSLCDRPVSTLLTVLPYLARFLQSDAVDVVLENLLTPVTSITKKIDKIYNLDILGMLKDMLKGLVESSNEKAGAKTIDYKPENQTGPAAMMAAYVLDVIENAESAEDASFTEKAFSNLASDEGGIEAQAEDDFTILDIVFRILDGVEINGVKLSSILGDTIFFDLASIAWLPENGSYISKVTIAESGRDGTIETQKAEKYTVDRESVLMQVLNIIVFTDGVKNLISSLTSMDFDLGSLTGKDDPNYLLVVLINGIFQSPEAAENLIINLLSWYDVKYRPARDKDYSDIDTSAEINYDEIGIDKSQLEKLPSDLDKLVSAIVPAVVAMLPEGALGGLTLSGENIEEMVHNLVVSLLADTADAPGFATKLVSMLVGFLGTNDTVGMILPMLREIIPGVDFTLEYFKQAVPAFGTYFADCETWADAAKLLVEDGEDKILPNTNSFGIKSFDDVLGLIANILTPLTPVLRLLLTEENLVLLEGVTITAGDGYDRLLVPVFEAFSLGDQTRILDKNEFKNLDNAAYAQQIVTYINAFITKVVNTPVETIVDALPQLVFFIYSEGLAQGIEQFAAPVLTLVDMVNKITAKKLEANGETYVALDIYALVLDLINEKVMDAAGLAHVEDIYGFIDAFLTAEGLEAIIKGAIEKSGKDIDLGFNIDGIFKMIVEKCCKISDVETVRFFGADVQTSGKRTVKGVTANRADTLIQIVAETILSGDLIKNLLGAFGVALDDTISTIIDAVTGENRYVILKVLLKYFNEYDVEEMVLEYLSFEKVNYDYSTYVDGTWLTQRKLRRALRKLDGSILSAVPGLLPMLETVITDNETVAAIFKDINLKETASLKDLVHEILEKNVLTDTMVGDLMNMLLGLLGGDDLQGTLSTVLPLVDQIVGLDLTPAGFAAKSSGAVKALIEAAAAAAPEKDTVTDEDGNETEVDHVFTWADVASYYNGLADGYDWGIDSETTFAGKKNAFIGVLYGVVGPLETVLNFLLRGEDIQILSEDGKDGVITLKGNDGYRNAVYPLLQALAADQFGTLVSPQDYMRGAYSETTLSAIVDGILLVVDTLCDRPVEYLLTLLPTLSYFISSNGIQVVIENLLSPVLALLDLAEPVVGPILENLIGKNLGPIIGDYMPEGTGREVTETVKNEDGTDETITYTAYSISEITGIAGEDGSNLIRIANELISGLLIKSEDGEAAEVLQILPEDFFASYAKHTITINEPLNSKYYYWYEENGKLVKVPADEYNHETMPDVVIRRYVVSNFKADIADSLVFLLDTVLSEDIIRVLADLMNLDLTDESNMISALLNGLIDGDVNGLVIADVITALFENYEITYPKLNGELIDLDHSHREDLVLNDTQNEQLDKIPEKLDSIISKAVPALLPLIGKLAADGTFELPAEVSDILTQLGDALKDYDAETDGGVLAVAVDSILSDMLYTNGMASTIARLLPTVFGMEIFGTIMPILSATGFVLEPQAYLATIERHVGKDDPAYKGMKELIGENTSWADILAANTPAEGETLADIDFGVKDEASFINAVAAIIDPLYPLLQALTMGKKLTLFGYNNETYIPVDNDPEKDPYTDGVTGSDADDRDDSHLGNGYVELMGVKLYEQGILPIIDALGGVEVFGRYDAASKTGVMSPAEFEAIPDCTAFVEYVFSLVLGLVDNLAGAPAQFLSRNLAAVLYYIGNDNVYKLVQTALELVNSLLRILDPVAGRNGVQISLDMVKLEGEGGLLEMLNGLLEGAGINFKLTKALIYQLAGKLGEFKTIDTLRTTADFALIGKDGSYVDAEGNPLSEEELAAGAGKITTLVGSDRYFLTGLLDFVLADGLLSKFIDTSEMDEAVKGIIENVTGPDAVENVVEIILKLLNEYLVEYKAIEDPKEALRKLAIDYSKRTIEKTDTQKAIDNLDSMVGSILAALGSDALGADSIEAMLEKYLYNDSTVNMLVGALVGLLAGFDEGTWETVDMVLNLVKELTGKDIDISPAHYKEISADLAAFIGDADTWAKVAESYTQYEYTYEATVTGEDGIETTETRTYFGAKDLDKYTIDGTEYVLTPVTDTDGAQNSKAVYDHSWGIDSLTSVDAKTEKLVSILCDILMPLDSVISLILCGGTYDFETTGKYGDSIGLFDEINIMGGSGYNYAVIPLLEMLGVKDVKTQAEYEIDAEANGSLSYILNTVLGAVNSNLDKPVSFILSLVADLAYLVSKDGLTTVISNLIAPINELIRAVEGVVPVSVALDLMSLITSDTIDISKVIKFYIGDDVKKHHAEVGVFIDLNAETLEKLASAAIAKFVPELSIDLSFLELAAKSAKADENGDIILNTSKVDTLWDKCSGVPGHYITGDPADALIAITEVILTSENIEGVLKLLGVNLDELDPALSDMINNILDNPSLLADAIIKLLSGSYNVEARDMIFYYLGKESYSYKDLGEWKLSATNAITKLDRIINNVAIEVIDLLAAGENPIELLTDISAHFKTETDKSLKAIVDYVLTSYAFNNDLVNDLLGKVIGALGGLDAATFDTIASVLKSALGVDITPAGFAKAGGKLAAFIGDAETWAELAKAHQDADGNVVLSEDWGVTDKDSFFGLVYEITAVISPLLDFLLKGDDLKIVIDEFTLKGNNAYENVFTPLMKSLGVELKDANGLTSNEMLEAIVDGLFELVDRIEQAPITTILEAVGGLSFLIANDGVAIVAGNLVSPIMGLLSVVDGIIDIDAILKGLIGMSLDEIINIAGERGEGLVQYVNNLIGSVEIAGPDGTVHLAQLLSEDFFVELSKYAVKPDWPLLPNVGDELTRWHIDATDVLMFVLQTVFTKETLQVICKVAGLDTNEQVASIVTGLAGKQDELVEIIIKLLNKYHITYNKIAQEDISKVVVEPVAPLTNANIENAIKAIDALVPTVLGLITGNGDGLEALLTGLISDLDVGNLIMNMLVPALSGLPLDDILGYVKQFSNIDLKLDPQEFKKVSFGSQLSAFIGDSKTWADVAAAYAQYVYTYTDENGEEAEYLSDVQGLTVIPGTETALTAVMADEDNQAVKMNSSFDWKLGSLDDVKNLVCDLLAPLDLVFKVILSGEDIVVLPDKTDAEDKAQITVTGGYGYNYGIIPLLEAFGIDPLSQEEYDDRVKADGSSIKCILDQVFSLVDDLCAAPVETLITKLANIFYFIGSDGINVALRNLIAPINEILAEVDGVFPLAIAVDLSKLGENGGAGAFATYLGKEHPGVPAGITLNISGEDIADGLNSFLGTIEIAGHALGLTLDLDWNYIAAMMAKTEDPAKMNENGAALLKTPTKQSFNVANENPDQADVLPYSNIQGDVADTFVALLRVLLTEENTEAIISLIKSVLPADMDPAIADAIDEILSEPDVLEKLIGIILVILTDGYNTEDPYGFIYKYLGKTDYSDAQVDTAIDKLDSVVGKAAPIIIKMLADTSKPEAEWGILEQLAANINDGDTLGDVINGLLSTKVFTADTFKSLINTVVGALAGFATAELTGTINDLLGIDLAPKAFAAATGYDALIGFVGDAATWADVKTNADDIDWGITDRDSFIEAFVSLLKPLDKLLGFILMGEDITITIEGEKVFSLSGGNAYETALKELLVNGLGLKDFGAVMKDAATSDEAVANIADYLLLLIDKVSETPFKAILTVVGNLSFFIANDDLDYALKNLLSPILGILGAVESVIPRARIDELVGGLLGGITLTDIINIGQNGGANIVKLVNGLLGSIELHDKETGEVIFLVNALRSNFFKEIAKAAIKVDKPTGSLNVGDDVTEWHVETGDTLLAVLNSVLTDEFLSVLCKTLGLDKSSDIGKIITSLAGRGEDLVGIIVKLLSEYTVEYGAYKLPELPKTVGYKGSDVNREKLDAALKQLDSLIPVIMNIAGLGEGDSLKDVVYPLFVKDEIANMLVSTIAKLLSGLPSETIDPIISYVNELTNLKNFSISPAAFEKAPFGSKLGDYIGGAKSWNEVWMNHSVVTGTDEDGNEIREAAEYAWGINDVNSFIDLVCDMLNPLDEILALLLTGGKITAFDDINIFGGHGYNYAALELLALLGIDADSQADYDAFVKKNNGSTLRYILVKLFERVDEILESPVEELLPMLANLCYVLGNDNLETMVQNLLAPVNNLIAAIDPIVPIAINVNLASLANGGEIAEMYLAKPHPGINPGVQVSLKGSDIANLLNNLLYNLEINGKPLGIKLDLDWLALASQAGADKDANGFIDRFASKGFSSSYDIYAGEDKYWNIIGDSADTLVAILELILTEENLDAILNLVGQPDGFGEPLDSIIDEIVKDPSKVIDIIISILGGGDIGYIPVQNRPIATKRFDYSTYFLLTEPNADIIANNLDDLIIKIMGQAGVGSIKQLVYGNYITGATINQLLDMIVPALAGDTVASILPILNDILGIDLSVKGFYDAFIDNYDYYADPSKHQDGKVFLNNGAAILAAAANKENGTWADVGAFAGTDWGFRDGDLQGFLRVLTDILSPLNPLFEFLLIGEGKKLNVLDLIQLKGSNGYDYGIIPLLEAFGIEGLLKEWQYRELCEKDPTQLIGYILSTIGSFADKLLDRPVDTLLTILPNVAYFISNEGIYLSVRNLLAPVFSILEALGAAYNVDFAAMLNLSKLLHSIDFGIEVLAAKYDLRIPEIDFYKLAQLGGTAIKDVNTSRSKEANSFITDTNPYPYITDFSTGKTDAYKGFENKTTQKFIVSDKGDTITLVLTWLLEMFGDRHNRDALVNWLADVFMLDSGSKQTVAYGIDRLFDTCSKYNVPDIIVAALFEALGIGIVVDSVFSGDMEKLQQILQEIFGALGSNEHCVYCSIAKVMEKITGIWNENIGSGDDYHDAEQEAQETLNWFQKLLKMIRDFFDKIFSVFR